MEQKLESMEEENEDLQKMALLFFIGSAIKRKKNKTKIRECVECVEECVEEKNTSITIMSERIVS